MYPLNGYFGTLYLYGDARANFNARDRERSRSSEWYLVAYRAPAYRQPSTGYGYG